MMRKIITTTLVLSPMLLHAQASPPVQPTTSTSTEMSKLVKPGTPSSSTPTGNSMNTTPAPIRVSTGIVAPQLVHKADIQWDGDSYANDKTIVIHMTVDPTGKPANLSVVRSISPMMDHQVLQSVSQYRFKPGTLDNAPYSVPMDLEIVVRNPDYR